MRFNGFRGGLAGAAALFLVACATPPAKVSTPTNKDSADQANLVESDPPPAKQEAQPARIPDRIQHATDLVSAGERALADGRLTQPDHDNAVNYFRAALLFHPENEQARSGLNQVIVNFAQVIREALASDNPNRAQSLLQQAKRIDPDNSLLAELESKVSQARAFRQQKRALAENTLKLDVASLNQRSEKLSGQLQALAQKVRDQDLSLLIIARTDAEGRWIYQQMRKGVTGYRLRGDIQMGRVPQISLLPGY